MVLSATVAASIAASLGEAAPTSDLGGSSGASARANISQAVTLTDGTGAGQGDLMFADRRTVTDGATEDLDLAGVLTDALGNTITAVRVKAIVITAADGNTTDLTIGADANAWATLLNAAGTLTLRPGSSIAAFAGAADAVGWTVTAGTGDILQVVNGAGADATYDIVIIAASA
jgi:hypothetical protein